MGGTTFVRVIFLCCLNIVLLGTAAVAKTQTWATTIRTGEQMLDQLCNGCHRLQLSVREFDNGNTFVKFADSVIGQDLNIYLPKEMTATDLMEALIITRTAQTNMAQNIKVVFNVTNLKEVKITGANGEIALDLAKLFYVAGADAIQTLEEIRTEFRSRHNLRPKRHRNVARTVIFDRRASPLAQRLRLSLALPEPIVSTVSTSGVLNNSHVILFAQLDQNSNDSFLESLSTASDLIRQSADVTYFTPYLPYARSDKIDQAGITVTGRLIADLIESTGVQRVSFIRAHAPQSQGFFSIPAMQISGRETINEFLKSEGVEVVVAPDAGAQKDVTLHAVELNLPVAVINKQRDAQTQQLRVFGISGASPAGKVVAVIDDETASGSTLAQAAETLRKQGAKRVITVVTHLPGDAGKAIHSPDIEKIAVTDTIPISKELSAKVTVLSLEREITQSLRKIFPESLACNRLLAGNRE